jgi:hypothetical protein
VGVLESGKFSGAKSTQELVLGSAIGFSANEESAKLLYKWFMTDKITTLSGKEIQDLEATMK